MKRSIIIASIMFTGLISFAQGTEIVVNGKTFIKTGNTISSLLETPARTRIIDYEANERLRRALPRIYVLNTDEELKTIIKRTIPQEIIDMYGDEGVRILFRVNPNGSVSHVSYGIDGDSPLYDMDIKIYSKLEDELTSIVRFNIPDKTIPSFWFNMPRIKLSKLNNGGILFSPDRYEPRY